MPRVWVDKQTRTTAATKKYVDNPYLIWFGRGKERNFLWKTRLKLAGPADFRGARRVERKCKLSIAPKCLLASSQAGFLVIF
jgi:hypothetical protein